MTHAYSFDTKPYYQTVATILFRRHGDDALWMANYALEKMRNLGDADGAEMWEGVMSAIFEIVTPDDAEAAGLH